MESDKKNWRWLSLLKVHVHAGDATSRAGGTASILCCATATVHAVRALPSDGAAVKSSYSAKHMLHNYDRAHNISATVTTFVSRDDATVVSHLVNSRQFSTTTERSSPVRDARLVSRFSPGNEWQGPENGEEKWNMHRARQIVSCFTRRHPPLAPGDYGEH